MAKDRVTWCRHLPPLFILLLLAISAPAQQAPPPPVSAFEHLLVAKKPDELPAHLLHRLGTARIHQPPGGIASIAIAPNGTWMATGDRAMTNQVYVWDLKTGSPRWIFQGHARWIARLEISADSEYLLASHHHDTLHNLGVPAEMVVWKVRTGEVVKYHQPTAWSLAQDGKTLAVGSPNRDPDNSSLLLRFKGFTVEVFDFPSHKPRRSIVHPTKGILSLALSPDGSQLAVGTGKEILLYDTATGKELRSIQGLKDVVHLLRFSPDGRILASVSDDLLPAGVPRSVELWRSKDGERIGTLTAEKGWPLRRLEFVSNGIILTQRFLGEHQLWNLETQRAYRTFEAGALALFDEGKSVAHNSDPKYGHAGRIHFEDLATGKPLPIQGSSAPLLPWKFSDDGKTVFTRTRQKADEDELVQAWDVATGKELADQRRREKLPELNPLLTKTSQDLGQGREIRYQAVEHLLSVVDTNTSQELFQHKVTEFPAWSLSPDKKRLAVFENTFKRRIIRIIDLNSLKDVSAIPISDSQSVNQYLFTPDGSSLGVINQGTLRLYNAATGKLHLERSSVIGPVIFSPDGRLMAASNLVGTVDLFDLKE